MFYKQIKLSILQIAERERRINYTFFMKRVSISQYW